MYCSTSDPEFEEDLSNREHKGKVVILVGSYKVIILRYRFSNESNLFFSELASCSCLPPGVVTHQWVGSVGSRESLQTQPRCWWSNTAAALIMFTGGGNDRQVKATCCATWCQNGEVCCCLFLCVMGLMRRVWVGYVKYHREWGWFSVWLLVLSNDMTWILVAEWKTCCLACTVERLHLIHYN